MATATQSRRTAKPKTNLLDCLPSHGEKIQMRYLSVLRNKVGTELYRKAQFELNQPFNWTEFKEQFNADYSDLTVIELSAHLKNLYGLNSAEEINTAFNQQQAQRRRRQERRGY